MRPAKLRVSPTSLNFNLDNWSQPQTVTVEAPQEDSDTSDERLSIRHTITEGANTASLDSTPVWVTDDDDGEALVGSRPADALWWAALTARRETGGATGYLDYEYGEDTGKLSDNTFILGGLEREIEGLFVQNGALQVWVDSGDGFQLPNNLVLHVGNVALTLGSASKQSFETTYNDGSTPTMRDHTYRWYSGEHGVSLSDRQVAAVWLEDPSGTYLPQAPRSVQAEPKDGAAELKWTAPPEVPSKPVLHYEYQKNGFGRVDGHGRGGHDDGGERPRQRGILQVPASCGERCGEGSGVGAVGTGDSPRAGPDRGVRFGAVVARREHGVHAAREVQRGSEGAAYGRCATTPSR